MIEVDPRLQDHAVGLELQIVEVVRQVEEAARWHWAGEQAVLAAELAGPYDELATVARVDSVAAGDSWPEFSRLALDNGILSSLSVPMVAGGDAIGNLNLYSRRGDGFDDCEQLGLTLAAPATLAVVHGRDVPRAAECTPRYPAGLREHPREAEIPERPPVVIRARTAGGCSSEESTRDRS